MTIAAQNHLPGSAPPAGLNGWAMRPDQVAELHEAIGGDMADLGPNPEAVSVLLVEAHDGQGRAAGGWSAIPETAIAQDQIGVRGHRYLDMLKVPREGRAASWADLRPIGPDGDRAQGRAACFCGSGAKAKRCPHAMYPPIVYLRSGVWLNQREWTRRDAFETALFGRGPGPVPKGQLRVAAAICSLSGRPFLQTTTDVDGEASAVEVADDLGRGLERELGVRFTVLGGAEVHRGPGVREEVDAPAS